MYIFWNRGLLMAPDPGDGSGGGSGDPAPGDPPPTGDPAPPPADPPPTGDPVPGDITMTSGQLSERLERDRAAQLQRMGFESEEQLTAMRERDAAATTAAEEARRSTLSREQTLAEDVLRAEGERDAFETERDDLRFQAHVSGICANVGVRNLDYALHMVEAAANATPEGQELDVEAFLRERVDPENPQHAANRAALGLEAPVVTTPVPVTNIDGNPPPMPPPAGGGDPKGFDAMDADAAAWQQRKEALGI